jgi:hypothetical protein
LGEQNDITEQAAAQMWAHAVAVTFPHTHPARRLSLEALSLPQRRLYTLRTQRRDVPDQEHLGRFGPRGNPMYPIGNIELMR